MNRRRASAADRLSRADAWKRAALSFLRGAGALLLVGFIVLSGRATWNWMLHGREFAIRTIRFSGLHRASEADLLRRSGLAVGRNIFSVNTAEAAAAMERADWIDHVRISRASPSTVNVVVQERQPVAVVNARGLVVIDGAARKIKNLDAADRLDLPVLTGLAADEMGDRTHPASPAYTAALAVLRGYRTDPMNARAPISELHVSTVAGDAVYTAWCGDPVVEVVLGAFEPPSAGGAPAGLHDVLRRLGQVWAELALKGWHARTIDLGNRDQTEWVPARLEPMRSG